MDSIYLPVSEQEVLLYQVTGVEDLLVLEAPQLDTQLALLLVERLACSAKSKEFKWSSLCVSDLETLLLRIRQGIFSDILLAEIICPTPQCGAHNDLSFSIEAYLDHHRPRQPRNVTADSQAGWFRLRQAEVSFRLPTIADQIEIAKQDHAERHLIERCMRPPLAPIRQLRQVERAMAALAPPLSEVLEGTCPHCGALVSVFFDVQQFCLRELREQAVFIYDDVHLLAWGYHWTEAEILAMPHTRRMQYAERVRQQRGQI